jgi:signal transduction histidine kinase
VELTGFPGLAGKTPVIRNAVVRKLGNGTLPKPVVMTSEQLDSGEFDAHYVQVEGRLINYSKKDGGDTMDVEVGSHVVSVHLPTDKADNIDYSEESRLSIQGLLLCQTHGQGDHGESYELIVHSLRSIEVLETPSWWTFIHTLLVMSALLVVLIIALAWVQALRHIVVERTQQLRDEIDLHKRTEAELEEKTQLLEDEIEERKSLEVEKERIHKELMNASRQAGMAEVATGVLHNVGNVLNSVNISTSIVTEKVRVTKASGISRVVTLLKEHHDDLPAFLSSDERGRKIPAYLETLAEALAQERQEIQKELALLRANVEHIKEIVATQQDFARTSGVCETVPVSEIISDAFKMHSSSFSKHGVLCERLVDESLTITTDKHRVMQILVNLLQNARQACGNSEGEKKVVIRVSRSGTDRIKIEVADNGMGIAPGNLDRIFVHGFTTKKDGHGFGLHSGALAAKALGGSLSVFSEGEGKGATFTLELPVLIKPGPIPSPESAVPRL